MRDNSHGVVLIVDDVEANRVILGEIVGSMGCKTVLAENGVQALQCVREELPNLVLTDISMPEMDGYELCRRLKTNVATKDIPIIFISAFDNPKDIVKGFDLGGGDYITKPFIPELVQARVNVHLRLYEATVGIREANRRLQVSVNEQLRQMEQERKNVLYALAGVAAENSLYGSGYIERMKYNCRILAQSMQLSPLFEDQISDSFVETVEFAAPLCDIGNLGIPKEILQKTSKLDESEWEQMKSHTRIGTKLLEDLKVTKDYNDFIQISADITHFHHENWDGSGYPEGKRGNEIPLAAQIVAMSSMFCALTEERSYRQSYDREKALEIMQQEARQKFNPDIFSIFCKVARQLR
ncbi:MAG: response regulator [bacterium]|nr:response regulator [bacterium]MCM1373925.1 response regulator [Muribaculum sp.]